MNKHIKFTILFLMLFAYSSCSLDKEAYQYEDRLLAYLDEVHKINAKGSFPLYILNLESCDPCVKLNLEMLNNLESSKNLVVILIGKERYTKTKNEVEKIKTKFQIYRDFEDESFHYELGLYKPSVFIFENSEISDFRQLSDFDMAIGKELIEDSF